ncbi:MAG: SDR family oxidoreductase [Bacteroidetes bacterium]|nr:SDR family oxidoreductase [Bacteroidota bacterium]
MGKLDGKTVFITGGLSGIGKACALHAAEEGANVVIADLKGGEMESTMEVLKKINSKAIFVECDVAVFKQVHEAVQKTISIFGTLDIALNNAGIGGEAGRVGELSEEAWLKVIGVNLNGVFNCMKHELEIMVRQKKGVIINMSSILGKVGFAGSSHYTAAKHAVLGLTQTAALEYATEGIRVNAICPGFIETPLLTKAGIDSDATIKQMIVDKHPMKRLGKSEEIAKGFLFLASDDSSFMTGTALEIDGGYLAV